MDLVDILYSRAPVTLNRSTIIKGATPLFEACEQGSESLVSKLLSLGAAQRMPTDDNYVCPLTRAVHKGFMGVVRVLMNEGGMSTVGGDVGLPKPIYLAVRFRQPRILRLLLTVDGEERRSEWANTNLLGKSLLHYGAAYCRSAEVSILLKVGADKVARDPQGRIPRDFVGVYVGRDGDPQMDQGEDVAVHRMLQRGPAYRARSWAWPSGKEADAGGGGDGDMAATALLSALPMKNPPVVDLRIFRPKQKSRRKFFVKPVGRYCAKDHCL